VGLSFSGVDSLGGSGRRRFHGLVTCEGSKAKRRLLKNLGDSRDQAGRH
jgi:hypothetical protein